MKVMTRLKDMLLLNEEYDEEENEIMEENKVEIRSQAVSPPPIMPVPSNIQNNRVVPFTSKYSAQKQELLNITMASYATTGDVANYIKEKKSIVVNMQNLQFHEVQRALDYLSGATDALEGTVEKVAENIYIFAPENVHLKTEQDFE
ncbi:hypothetical protein AN639_08885 [Candidatus Epulonipiscium fishelsonii]|uniref:Uncharacterized protein n=1 Tax=Candidatus Epulonipiscium fishelsonii TaxID=77094 RepID=A0ACC8XDJ3_9FIRM|nr:hypothetical protein AN639_08885 [Epulopiscium sp. SCG-B05WGA-EpuloA1]ONI40962.1 hypothetical protein AN396_04170 [Epulopiscium sp. SCG-B11WGA-EpuloA1]